MQRNQKDKILKKNCKSSKEQEKTTWEIDLKINQEEHEEVEELTQRQKFEETGRGDVKMVAYKANLTMHTKKLP